jgi:CheY-like chemotaxis protein
MPKHILWLDNDLPYIRPYVNALRAKDFEVSEVASLSHAERLLEQAQDPFDLIIIDVMVPTQDDDELKDYPVLETDFGHKSGLVFYNRMKHKLGAKLPPVAVTTVRLDQGIRDEFVKSGLKAEHVLTKYNLRDAGDFLNKIRSILGG